MGNNQEINSILLHRKFWNKPLVCITFFTAVLWFLTFFSISIYGFLNGDILFKKVNVFIFSMITLIPSFLFCCVGTRFNKKKFILPEKYKKMINRYKKVL